MCDTVHSPDPYAVCLALLLSIFRLSAQVLDNGFNRNKWRLPLHKAMASASCKIKESLWVCLSTNIHTVRFIVFAAPQNHTVLIIWRHAYCLYKMLPNGVPAPSVNFSRRKHLLYRTSQRLRTSISDRITMYALPTASNFSGSCNRFLS